MSDYKLARARRNNQLSLCTTDIRLCYVLQNFGLNCAAESCGTLQFSATDDSSNF